MGAVYLADDAIDHDRLPPELRRLLTPVDCDSGDASVTVSGRWRGILGADGHTELDLKPPYDVQVDVVEAARPDYEGADLTVRVPERLGRPLSRKDIETSLWEGGMLTITFNCQQSAFVASAIEAAPPE